MHRIVHHHGYVRRGFTQVCDILDTVSSDPLILATRQAAEFADAIADDVVGLSEFFDVDEDVRVQATPLRRHQESASFTIRWIADPSKRLLPNVSATLEVNPILERGANAITELVLHGEYDPPDVHHRGAVEFFLERRVVNAALHVFLDRLVSSVEELVPGP